MKNLFSISASILFSTVLLSQTVLKTNLQDSNPKYIKTVSGFEGIGIDIMKAIEQTDPTLKFSYSESFIPFARICGSLESGEIDVFFGMVKNDEREKQYLFIDPPLYATYNKMAVKKDDPLKDIDDLNQIRKLGDKGTVLVDFETAHHAFLVEAGGLTLDASGKNRSQNLNKLIADRGRFYYSTDLGLYATIKEEALKDKVRVLPHVFQEDAQYAAFSKKVANETVDRVKKALVKLQGKGALKKIRAKYEIN